MKSHLGAALAAAALFLASPALADEPTKPAPTAAELKTELGLDDATTEKVQAILTSAQAQAQTLRTQKDTALTSLRTAYESGDEAKMKSALDELKDVKGRLRNLEADTMDRLMGELSVRQRAAFVLGVAEKHGQLSG